MPHLSPQTLTHSIEKALLSATRRYPPRAINTPHVVHPRVHLSEGWQPSGEGRAYVHSYPFALALLQARISSFN